MGGSRNGMCRIKYSSFIDLNETATFEEGVFVVFRPAGNIAAFHVWTCLIWPLIAVYNSIFTDQISVDIDSPLLPPSFSSVPLFNTFLFLSVAWHRWTKPAYAAHSPGPAHSSVISPAWGLFSHISKLTSMGH